MFSSKEIIVDLKNGKNRLLGIDFGEKRIGISLCDLTWSIASPFKTLSPKELIQQIAKIVNLENIAAIIIGWPLNMDGSKSQQCEKIEKFVLQMKSFVEIPFFAWDERLSTMAVHRTMLDADLSRKRQKEVVDKMASAYMLQGFIDSMKY